MSRIVAMVLVVFGLVVPAQAITLSDKMHSRIQKGNRHYDDGNHDGALQEYLEAQEVDSTNSVPYFNAGDALYRMGQFQDGMQSFLRSAGGAEDSIAAMSYYNLGNSMFRAGDMRSAVEAYKKSLLIDPDDEDAKHNLEYALRMIEEQQQQQQDQEQSQEQDQQDQQQRQDQQQEQENQEQQQQPPDQAQQDEQGRQEPPPSEISQDELERILAAIEASDKNTQEEMLKKASRRKRISGKDW
jgi:Ca-activated chloride channel family protein